MATLAHPASVASRIRQPALISLYQSAYRNTAPAALRARLFPTAMSAPCTSVPAAAAPLLAARRRCARACAVAPAPCQRGASFSGRVAPLALATPRRADSHSKRTHRPAAAALPVSAAASTDAFVPVLSVDDLPKGTRRTVAAGGKAALLFWYRDAVYAVEPRSPAEGAYSEGFAEARLTQDGCIECPGTKSTFDLKTGEIKLWYPDNPVLRALTPIETCRPLETFPVRVDSAAGVISVDFEASNLAAAGMSGSSRPVTTGGAATSLERNNVYGLEPRVYVQDGEGDAQAASDLASGKISAAGKRNIEPATLVAYTVALAIVAVAGTALAISKESIVGLVVFWAALLTPVGWFVFTQGGDE